MIKNETEIILQEHLTLNQPFSYQNIPLNNKNQKQQFQKTTSIKVRIHLQDKVNKLQDILEQYEIISPVNKDEQPKGNIFINPVNNLAKEEQLKIVLDARYLNSLIDESKCNWPNEPIQVVLTKTNDENLTTADMNSAYNQKALVEQSRPLT